MTPDEAVRHEWLCSSSSSHASSSSSAIASSSTVNASASTTTTSVETSRESAHAPQTVSVTVSNGPRQRATTMEEPPYTMYRMFKGNRRVVQKVSTGADSTDNGGGLMVKSKLNGSASSHALASSTQTTSAATSRHASTGDIVASLDPNLDDSGTFLPPIL